MQHNPEMNPTASLKCKISIQFASAIHFQGKSSSRKEGIWRGGAKNSVHRIWMVQCRKISTAASTTSTSSSSTSTSTTLWKMHQWQFFREWGWGEEKGGSPQKQSPSSRLSVESSLLLPAVFRDQVFSSALQKQTWSLHFLNTHLPPPREIGGTLKGEHNIRLPSTAAHSAKRRLGSIILANPLHVCACPPAPCLSPGPGWRGVSGYFSSSSSRHRMLLLVPNPGDGEMLLAPPYLGHLAGLRGGEPLTPFPPSLVFVALSVRTPRCRPRLCSSHTLTHQLLLLLKSRDPTWRPLPPSPPAATERAELQKGSTGWKLLGMREGEELALEWYREVEMLFQQQQQQLLLQHGMQGNRRTEGRGQQRGNALRATAGPGC